MLGDNLDGYGLFHSCNIKNLYLGRDISYANYREESGEVPLTARAFYGMDMSSIRLGSLLNKTEILWGELNGGITIFSLNSEPPSLLDVSEGAFTTNQYGYAKVFVPAGALAAYKADPNWGPFIHMQEIGMSDISSVQTDSELGMKAEDGRIKVENANGRVNLYDISGRLLHSAEPDGGYVEIAVPKRGVYIVEVGKQTVKVAM